MNQRGGPSPVLVPGVRDDDLRPLIRAVRRSREEPVRDARLGIGLRPAREREEVRGIEERREAVSVTRGLREAMVEAPAPRAGGVNEQPVEDFPAGLVGVEPLVQEVAQETPALRDAGADGRRDRKLRTGIVAGP